MRYFQFITTLFLLLISGCSRHEQVTENWLPVNPSVNPITGHWIVEAFETIGDTVIHLDAIDTIRVVFDDDTVLNGGSRGRCGNYYHGTYKLGSGSELQTKSIRSTEAVCPLSSYWSFIHALTNVSRFKLEDRLYLYYDSGLKRLWLRREVAE